MRGIDTTFLLAHELAEIPVHTKARELVRQSSRNGDARFALAPQVLMEFLHVVTDPRRFQKPLPMEEAVSRAEFWWGAKEVRQLAASLHQAGVHRIITQNRKDFEIFGVFQIEELGG
ncbi:MAG: hypothetical protein EBT30_04635 [Verrucomicrobia bacterium]|nr:hypothetical protein [Verrucomicrobiota bacterium]